MRRLSREAKNAKLAKKLGWERGCHWSGDRIEGYWCGEEFATELPNYYESVQAFAQAEKSLSEKNRKAYVKKIIEFSKHQEGEIVLTTQEDRVDALGASLKLWDRRSINQSKS